MNLLDMLTASISGTDEAGLSTVAQKDRPALDNNSVSAFMGATGDMMGAISHLQFGLQAQQAAAFQAIQLRQNAGQAQATAQHQAFDIDRQSQYVASQALAHAAAGGGGASDPTVVNLIARNAGEFAYRKAVALYQGEDKARLLNLQADAKEYEGANTKANSVMVAGAQVIKGGTSLMAGMAKGASLYSRFGNGGPQTNPNPLG